MPIVTFQLQNAIARRVEVAVGTTLFDAALKLGLPVASSCSADSVCGKCNMQVLQGVEALSEQGELELRLLKRDKNPPTDRISCQAKVLGDCRVTTRYW